MGLGINPKVPPVELLSPDFIASLNRHAHGDEEAKASEMEHAIRKHCTVHFDEDPAFYRTLSEKLEQLIAKHSDDWRVLASELDKLRSETAAGRKDVIDGLTKEETTFYDYIVQLAFGEDRPPKNIEQKLKPVMAQVVGALQGTIGIIDFWNNPVEQKRLRGELSDIILMADIPELSARVERLAVEIMKLAKNRHNELLKDA